MLPEWLWIILIGAVVLGLVGNAWKGRNRGFLTTEKHIELCGKMKEGPCMENDKMMESFNNSLSLHTQSLQGIINAKFDAIDEKIESKVLRELRTISNGNGHSGRRVMKKKKSNAK